YTVATATAAVAVDGARRARGGSAMRRWRGQAGPLAVTAAAVTGLALTTGVAGAPAAVARSSGASRSPMAYVADFLANAVTPINTATNTAGAPIPVGTGPTTLALSPDGRTLYVANTGSDTVTPIS